MKLNNRGWGYRMMTILMSILVIFLGIAIFYIYKYYSTIGKELPDGNYYISGEQ